MYSGDAQAVKHRNEQVCNLKGQWKKSKACRQRELFSLPGCNLGWQPVKVLLLCWPTRTPSTLPEIARWGCDPGRNRHSWLGFGHALVRGLQQLDVHSHSAPACGGPSRSEPSCWPRPPRSRSLTQSPADTSSPTNSFSAPPLFQLQRQRSVQSSTK